MRRLLMSAALLLAVVVAPGEAQVLAAGGGLAYEDPDPDPTQFGEAGSALVLLGTVSYLYDALPGLPAHTVTYHLASLEAVDRFDFGTSILVLYAPGRLSFYENPHAGGTTPGFGSHPPNPTEPATFVDGSLVLTGPVTSFVVSVTSGGMVHTSGEFIADGGHRGLRALVRGMTRSG